MEELPVVKPPYLPPKEVGVPEYTLVLDLDETLIHYSDRIEAEKEEAKNNNLGGNEIKEDDDWCFYVRPGLNTFLTNMAKSYELVIYTAAMRDYASYFMSKIDPNEQIKHILCREHCQIHRGNTEPSDPSIDDEAQKAFYAAKDLRLIGRDLNKTLIIDNLAENFKFTTPDNGIHIEDFTGDMDDCELGRLGLFLERLVKN